MTARAPLPPELGAEFTVRDALRHGVSRQRLDRRDLQAAFRGVRMPARDETLIGRCRALALVLPEGAAFCGSTAAILWDLPLPIGCRGIPLRVSSLHPARAIRHRGTVGSQRREGDAARVHGLPVLGPEATWISLAHELSTHDLTAVADRLISGTLRVPPLSSRVRLVTALAGNRGGRHVRALRRALDDAREPVWSRPETLLRLLIVAAGIPEPTPNYPTADGEAIIDLAWPDLHIAIEYDGRWHDRTPEEWALVAIRRERLIDAGWAVVQVRAAELFGSPHALVARLVRRRASAGFPADRSIDLTRLPRFGR